MLLIGCYRCRQKDVGPIAQAVLPAVEDLVARLSAETIQPRPEAEVPHTPSLRRVNAALALFVLGEPKRGSLVLGDLGDPTARSLLVHSLGSAGVAPKDLVALTEDPSNAPPVRRQLLLAMGEIPGSMWSPTDLAHAQRLALSLYSDDPDPGVHGRIEVAPQEVESRRLDREARRQPAEPRTPSRVRMANRPVGASRLWSSKDQRTGIGSRSLIPKCPGGCIRNSPVKRRG